MGLRQQHQNHNSQVLNNLNIPQENLKNQNISCNLKNMNYNIESTQYIPNIPNHNSLLHFMTFNTILSPLSPMTLSAWTMMFGIFLEKLRAFLYQTPLRHR